MAQERPVRRQERLGSQPPGRRTRVPGQPGGSHQDGSDHRGAGDHERQPPAGEARDGSQARHADDRRARHAGGRPPQCLASLCACEVGPGNGQRGAQYRRIAQAARQGADEEHGKGWSQAKGEKTNRGRNETEEDHATVSIAVG